VLGGSCGNVSDSTRATVMVFDAIDAVVQIAISAEFYPEQI
jgi:hypothetical protein